ncbi:MAG: sulfite exporter TauE/SafE family protein [Bacillota bacterium]|nr:sulfite exporter TauE/SafE family protein [Bacillota bacterium]
MEYLYILLIMLVAGLVQGSCGFGAGLIAMSIMPFIFDYKTALPIMYVCAIFICLRVLLSTYRSINWKVLALPTLVSLVGRVAGLFVFKSFENETLSIMLGVLIFATAIYQLFWGGKIHIRPTPVNGSLTGLLSGVLGGLASSSGPPLVVYYMNAKLEKIEYIATIQMTFLAGSLFSISLLASTGVYNGEILSYAAVGAVGVILGTTIGLKVFHAMKRTTLQKVINVVLLAMGISLIIKSAV